MDDDNGLVSTMRFISPEERQKMMDASFAALESSGKLLDDIAAQRQSAEGPMTLEELYRQDDENRRVFEAMQASDIVRKAAHTEPKPMTDAMRARQANQQNQQSWEAWLRSHLDAERKFLIQVVGEAFGQMLEQRDTEIATLRAELSAARADLKTLEAKREMDAARLSQVERQIPADGAKLMQRVDGINAGIDKLSQLLNTHFAAQFEKGGQVIGHRRLEN